jgi:hypothetical protein
MSEKPDLKELRARAYARAVSNRRWTCEDSDELLDVIDRLESAEAELSRLRAVVGEVLEECARADWAMEPHGPGEVETTVIRSILRRGEVGG